MKNLIKLLTAVLILLSVSFSLREASANALSYKLAVTNLNYTSEKSLEFDIYLLNTSSDKEVFRYVLGQYFFEFNPKIANGEKLVYSIIGSDLPLSLQPRNPSVSGNQLRLAVNTIPSKDNLPLISDNSSGTLIARMRLETSAEKFSEDSFDLKLRSGPENPFTKVFAYVNNQIKDITIPQEITLDNNSPKVNEGMDNIPKEYALFQNYPNPFNPSTSIKFDIPNLSNVKLLIYDITGREIAVLLNAELQPGSYNYKWNASEFASGIYFYKIQAGDFSQIKRMVLIK